MAAMVPDFKKRIDEHNQKVSGSGQAAGGDKANGPKPKSQASIDALTLAQTMVDEAVRSGNSR